ncbi:histidinol-phosphate transaminase [Helicobacter turcicus]|uniref:Histidinol-phosphate aminotransferase n=1 Tax=Helicobacter turcicus TaxID=2867412 RepID=A0ABS7JNH1_9HELI|nr:histidinol-phosphate transaminase [Helicobacter turcicus]MBX7490922.1 histidinol-phosphate transaminase [Helicobacter turcicus]MBX7545776.1 histidinol-phosphate transaminase [Helicobacter turcicus]
MTFNTALDSIKIYEAGLPIELAVRKYGIAEYEVVKLASNENPLGASPKAIDAIMKVAQNAHLYPDDSMYVLKESLAKHFNVTSNTLIIGAGSDQIIEFCIHAKANHTSKVLMAKTTFAMYEIYAKSVGAQVIRTSSHEHNLQEFLEAYKAYKPAIIFLCIPNNPLGECLDSKETFEFLKQVDSNCLVIIDGAYQEYAKAKDSNKALNPKALMEAFPNVIYTGTFSKAYGLGGMRVGYGIANVKIIQALSKLRPPFNITTPSLAAAVVALEDTEHLQRSIENNLEQMPLFENFAREKGFKFTPSYTNFITYYLEYPLDSTEVAEYLFKKGMIIRNLASYGLNAIRITIGTHVQNEKFFALFNTYLKQK